MNKFLNSVFALTVALSSTLALGVDINGQLVKAQFEKRASAPATCTQARVYFDTSELRTKVCDGTV